MHIVRRLAGPILVAIVGIARAARAIYAHGHARGVAEAREAYYGDRAAPVEPAPRRAARRR